MLQHRTGNGTDKFRNPPRIHVRQQNGHTALDPVAETVLGLPNRWVGGISNNAVRTGSAASKACSRAMMWSRPAAVPASSSESTCDGLRPAPMGASREGQRIEICVHAHVAAQSIENRITNMSFEIEDDERATI